MSVVGNPYQSPITVPNRPGAHAVDAGTQTEEASSSHVVIRRAAVVASFFAVVIGAFVLRAIFVGQHSAYMDEKSQILIGRYLIEQNTDYVSALEWSYGSYLWPLVAGAADIVGGLELVRLVTSAFSAVMVIATALATLWLAPARMTYTQRWIAALLAGTIMAVSPTAIALGQFATYDAMAGAGFMLGIALLIAGRNKKHGLFFLAAAVALFFGFLAKYVTAIYFPFICLYLMADSRRGRDLARVMLAFIVPLTALCAGYFLLFRNELIVLLEFSTQYTDLESETPMREYFWQRPEVWALAVLAALGWRHGTRFTRHITVGGSGIMLLFHAIERPDFDFWKHSIYVIFFFAPLAAFVMTPVIEGFLSTWRHRGTQAKRGTLFLLMLVGGLIVPLATSGVFLVVREVFGWQYQVIPWNRPEILGLYLALAVVAGLLLAPLAEIVSEGLKKREPGKRSIWNVSGVVPVAALVLLIALTISVARSRELVTFYPNLNPALAAIDTYTDGAPTVLTDDTAVRYYLYPEVPSEFVTDPFYVNYKGETGIDGYRQAITDRFYDAIILDGGITGAGNLIRNELGDTINTYYDRVYATESTYGSLIEIYKPVEGVLGQPSPDATILRFDEGAQSVGGRSVEDGLQPGADVEVTSEREWNGQPTLRFTVDQDTPQLGIQVAAEVSRVSAWVYVEDVSGGRNLQAIGMFGFNEAWEWRDDGYQNLVPVGRWFEVTWDLSDPGYYHELGLAFPGDETGTIYVGQIVIEPLQDTEASSNGN